MFWLLLLLAVSLIFLLHKWTFGYWKRRNVPGPKPTFLVGNLGENFLLKKSIAEVYYDIYNKFQEYPFVGIYRVGSPCLLVRDPDLIKSVAVKNFKNFHNNELFLSKEVDPLVGRNPLFLKDEEWKQTRTALTPCFTSGKMKTVFPLLVEIGNKLVQYLNQQIESGETCLEAKELCTKITLENVALCAFGLDAKCFEEPNSEFRDLAQKFLSTGTIQSIKFMIITVLPFVTKLIPIKFVSKDVEDRLRCIVNDTISYREKNNIERPDFLHTMNQLRHTSSHFDMEDVVSHATGFFGDGYETSSIVMSFLLFELACHPDIQDKLRDEIQIKLEQNKGKLTYELVTEMEYLEACLNESQRKNPTVGALLRSCNEKFTLTPSNTTEYKEISVTVEPGTTVILPWGALFLDPKYFPDPDKYMPERFLKENKETLAAKGVFKPFGDGPRACLGQRFGTLQIKVGVVHILNNFRLSFNEKTKMPLKYDPVYFMLSPIGGLWINVEKLK